jgi:hypothetical protein
MTSELKQKIQFALVVAIAVAGTRAAYILYERHVSEIEQTKQQAKPLNPDYYVVPRRLHPYDLKSARQLTQQPVWVKEGYRYTYYPYDESRHGSDFSHEAGQLLPIEKLEIQQVVTDVTPSSAGQRQVMAVFAKDGKTYAFPIGTAEGREYQIYSDEMLYIQDPHELYKHWPAEVWDAIAQHQVKPGMNELQADFAIGMGIPEPSGDAAIKTVNYPNGGRPVSITYRDGKAASIRQKDGPAAHSS